MEPVTSKTNARVDAPSGTSSAAFVAPGVPASCPADRAAADRAKESHNSLEPISEPGAFSGKTSRIVFVLLSPDLNKVNLELTAETSDSQKSTRKYSESSPDAAALNRDPGLNGSHVGPVAAVPVPAAVAGCCLLDLQLWEPLFQHSHTKTTSQLVEGISRAKCPMHESKALIGREVLGTYRDKVCYILFLS